MGVGGTVRRVRGKRGVSGGGGKNGSIADGFAKSCPEQGAELAFTWEGDALKKRVEPLAKELGAITLGHCDVTDPDALQAAIRHARAKIGKFSVLLNNAANDVRHQLADIDAADFERHLAVNLRQQIFATQAVSPARRQLGRPVNGARCLPATKATASRTPSATTRWAVILTVHIRLRPGPAP